MNETNTDSIAETTIENNKKFLNWVQTFTKKIVTITFILFVVLQLFNLYLIYMEYKSGELMYLDTLITESNETFRVVIGGYIVKAACENTVKIICSIVSHYLGNKYGTTYTTEDELEDDTTL